MLAKTMANCRQRMISSHLPYLESGKIGERTPNAGSDDCGHLFRLNADSDSDRSRYVSLTSGARAERFLICQADLDNKREFDRTSHVGGLPRNRLRGGVDFSIQACQRCLGPGRRRRLSTESYGSIVPRPGWADASLIARSQPRDCAKLKRVLIYGVRVPASCTDLARESTTGPLR